jgi:hypothetical protein
MHKLYGLNYKSLNKALCQIFITVRQSLLTGIIKDYPESIYLAGEQM